MAEQKHNMKDSFSEVKQYFSPKIIGEVNDVFVKIAKVKGQDVPWHIHDFEDELFYIVILLHYLMHIIPYFDSKIN